MSLFPADIIERGLNGLDANGILVGDDYVNTLRWFLNTPGANPQPDNAALVYYWKAGYDQLVKDVAAIRKANPALARDIDDTRMAMGLPVSPPEHTTPLPVVTPPPPVVTPPPPVIVTRPPAQPLCPPGYEMVDDKGCVPSEFFTQTCPAGFRWDASVQDCIRTGIYTPCPPGTVRMADGNCAVNETIKPPIDVVPQELLPIYTKQYPYPTAESDIYGYLYGQDELDKPIRRSFKLKKGDPIPVNWQAEIPMSTDPVVLTPTTTPAAGGTGTLLLAAIAAYLIGG